MTGWDDLFAIQDAYDTLARDAALGGKMKLTNEQAIELQQKIIDQALAVVTLKRKDYSGDVDPFANFRMSQFVGVPAWKGCMVRLMDKLSRIYRITEAGAMYVKDETLMDTAADAINYICILMGLICEELGLQDEWLNEPGQQTSLGEYGKQLQSGDVPYEPRWVPYAGGLDHSAEAPWDSTLDDFAGEGTS